MNPKNYAKMLNASDEVIYWIEHNLKNYLLKNSENQDEIEHIIDYLVGEEAPDKLIKMSYEQAKINSIKWSKKLQNKGEHIKETTKDTEVILDFKDGFKIVKLIGKNAYEREGYLMRHCVAGYYGKSKEIYSLRDKDNIPHCTIEKDNQIKGKGNGDIHPNYVNYVVKFLEHVGMTVGDNEMSHLGYMNVEKIKKDLNKNTKFFNKIYLPSNEKLLGKDGKEFASLDLLDIKPLIKEDINGNLKINFELISFIKLSTNFLFSKKTKSKKISGYSSKNAISGDYSQNASSGDFSKNASSGDYSQNASSGDYSQNASSGDFSKNASSGDYSQNASSGESSQNASSGYSSQNASSGGYSQNASSGDSSQNEMTGEHSVSVDAGNNGIAKGKIGCWFCLSEWENIDNIYQPVCVKSVKIDGIKIKEDVWYQLKNGKFVEVK